MKTRLYKAFYESKEFGNGSTLVTSKSKAEALRKASEIGLIVGNVKQEGVRFTSTLFLRWIDVQLHFVWSSDTSKEMNQGVKTY